MDYKGSYRRRSYDEGIWIEMKTYDKWPCLECIVRPICSCSCKENVRFYEILLHEFSLNPRRTIERYTFLQGKSMDWILQRSLFRMVKFMNSYTRVRLAPHGIKEVGPHVILKRNINNELKRLYERSNDDPM